VEEFHSDDRLSALTFRRNKAASSAFGSRLGVQAFKH
jgi:hypothetical protein